ncbi:retrotransposon protein, putative, ty1-copia subclass, partial [Tanacetum coccineum]
LTSDFAKIVRNYNMHNMGKTIGELHALLIEYEICLPKKAATPQVMAIQGGRIQKANKKSLNTKGNSEYISQEIKDYLKACEIVQQLTPPYTPQHNGVFERRNRTLLDMVDKTQYGLWYGKVPNLSYLKVWGCEALVKRDTPDKIQQRSVKCIFIGYPKETMGYYFYFPPKNKIVVVRSKRTHRSPNRLCLNVEVEEYSLGDLNEPNNYKAALLDPRSDKGLDAMIAEMKSMKDNKV